MIGPAWLQGAAAAQAERDAAAQEAAYELLAIAELAPLSDLQRAQAARLLPRSMRPQPRRWTGAPQLGQPAREY